MLSGKVCIVTGSTAGIGKGIARSFLENGAFVFINGRSESSVSKVIREFADLGFTNTYPVIADLSNAEGCESFYRQVSESGKESEIDVLVNNMGIFGSGDFFDFADEVWLEYFNVNVMSTVRICRKYLKGMLERNKGRVIVISSECGLRPIADMLPYTMTKAAQLNLARGMAELTKGTNVTVNSLLPGPTATEGLDSFIEGLGVAAGTDRAETIANYFRGREPTSLLARFLTVEEVANVAMFLASDLSSGINGASQLVEGGIIRCI